MGQIEGTFFCCVVPWCVCWDLGESIEQNMAGVLIWSLISETGAPTCLVASLSLVHQDVVSKTTCFQRHPEQFLLPVSD